MEETKNKTDVAKAADFVANIIDSCNNPWHLKCSQRLIELFKDGYGDKHGGKIALEMLNDKIISKIPMIELF